MSTDIENSMLLSSEKTLERADRWSETPIPIELPTVAGWKEVPIHSTNEHEFLNRLVPIGPFTAEYNGLYTDSIYFGERESSPYQRGELVGSLISIFMRKEVADRVGRAEKLLPPGIHTVVFDAYRTLEVQQALFDTYFSALKVKQPDWSDDELLAETQKYVSVPSKDPTKPSPHNTGGSVDLALYRLPENIDREVSGLQMQIDDLAYSNGDNNQLLQLEMQKIALIQQNAELLEFGTAFDHGGSEAALNYFEKLAQTRELTPREQEAASNRRILYHAMMAVGMQAYEDEWWHYNSPWSQMGAKVANLPFAQYGAAQIDPSDGFEASREAAVTVLSKLHKGSKLKPVHRASSTNRKNYSDWKKASQIVGDPKKTSIAKAAVIKPS